MEGKYVIVTGGSRGIGLETTRGLMAQGAHVVMAARDVATCQAAQAKLEAERHRGTCACAQLDLEDWASVRRFAEEQRKQLRTARTQLHVLVNNAGIMGVGNSPSGEDRHMRCNHLGPYLLTRLLESELAPGARVVNVASRAHYAGAIKFDGAGDLTAHPSWWLPQYARSKLANVVFTSELTRRWATGPQRIQAYSVSPGFVSTTLFTSLPWGLSLLARPLTPLIARSPAQGADTVIYAATAPELEGRSELFLHDRKPLKALAVASDPILGKSLWEWSERMTGLTPTSSAGKGS